MNACWNQMAVKVTWRVNGEKRAEQGTLWNHNSSGQEEEEEFPEKIEEWWTRPASDRVVQSLLQAQSLARMTSWTGSRLLSF